MNLYDIKLSTYIPNYMNSNSTCGGYAHYFLEAEAESEEEAKYIALQVADPDSNRNACVTSIEIIEAEL
jgi:hypothetical protein